MSMAICAIPVGEGKPRKIQRLLMAWQLAFTAAPVTAP